MKKKKLLVLVLLLMLLSAAGVNAQVSIGTVDEPREGAILDLYATDKGLLLPQVRLTDIGAYLPEVTPIDGMLIFNTNEEVGEGKGVYVWDNDKVQWVYNGYRAGPVVVPVTEVIVSSPVDVILSGGEVQFTAAVLPEGATTKAVSWEVIPGTGTGIIDDKGLFTAEAPGSVQIKAKSVENELIFGSKNITVTVPSYPVTAITVQADGNKSSIPVGTTLQLFASVEPPTADNKAVTWTSDDEAIASVNLTSGLVTAKSPGIVHITATAVDGSAVTGTYELEITPVLVTGFTLTASAIAIPLNTDITVTAGSFTPANAALKEVDWNLISAPAGTYLVDIETNGTVATIHGGATNGTATIKATAKDDETETVTRSLSLDVKNPSPVLVNSITLAGGTCVRNDDAIRIYASAFTPAAVTNKALNWSITGGGKIKEQNDVECWIVADGTGGAITVTATAQDAGKKTGTFATYGAKGDDEEGDLLNDGTWDYPTWKFPNGIGTWTTKNSRYGTASYMANPATGAETEGYYYTSTEMSGACPAGWHNPARSETDALAAYWLSQCMSQPAKDAWWSAGRVGGYVRDLQLYSPADLWLRPSDNSVRFWYGSSTSTNGSIPLLGGATVRCVLSE
jgi:hypothetical protein